MKSLLHELRGCRDKKTYFSKKDANKQARKDTERYGKTMRAYECDVCCFFHLTSKPDVAKPGKSNG